MTFTAYDVGDVARISAVFQNDSLVATDPTVAILTVRQPDGTESVARWPTPGVGEGTVVKDSTGNFHYDLSITLSGELYYRWEGTGAVASADEGYLFVRDSAFA